MSQQQRGPSGVARTHVVPVHSDKALDQEDAALVPYALLSGSGWSIVALIRYLEHPK